MLVRSCGRVYDTGAGLERQEIALSSNQLSAEAKTHHGVTETRSKGKSQNL